VPEAKLASATHLLASPLGKLASAARLMRVFCLDTLPADGDLRSRNLLDLETGRIKLASGARLMRVFCPKNTN